MKKCVILKLNTKSFKKRKNSHENSTLSKKYIDKAT